MRRGERRQEGQVGARSPGTCVPPLGSTDCIYHEGVEEPEQERSVTRIAF